MDRGAAGAAARSGPPTNNRVLAIPLSSAHRALRQRARHLHRCTSSRRSSPAPRVDIEPAPQPQLPACRGACRADNSLHAEHAAHPQGCVAMQRPQRQRQALPVRHERRSTVQEKRGRRPSDAREEPGRPSWNRVAWFRETSAPGSMRSSEPRVRVAGTVHRLRWPQQRLASLHVRGRVPVAAGWTRR